MLWETLVRIFILASSARETWPKDLITHQMAMEHATSAMIAAGDDLEPELLLAMAWKESRFKVHSVSRKNGKTGKREHGAWPSLKRGPSFVAPYFCGNLQAKSLSWAGCIALRALPYGYVKGADELRVWIKDRRCRGRDVRCALAGYGYGNNGVERVRQRRKWLRDGRLGYEESVMVQRRLLVQQQKRRIWRP